jgi:hypothetical protein
VAPREERRAARAGGASRQQHGGEGASRERTAFGGGRCVRDGAPAAQGHGGAPGDGDPIVLP